MDKSKLGFFIHRTEIIDGDIRFQIKNINDDKLEVTLGFVVDPYSGDVKPNAVRHFTDSNSAAWFADSQSWHEWMVENGLRINP